MPSDARQLGLDGTMAVVRRILVERFRVTQRPEDIPADVPLFAVGVGLSSIDGMEFLMELEKEFGVRIKEVEWWVSESPTLRNVAELLLRSSGSSTPSPPTAANGGCVDQICPLHKILLIDPSGGVAAVFQFH